MVTLDDKKIKVAIKFFAVCYNIILCNKVVKHNISIQTNNYIKLE